MKRVLLLQPPQHPESMVFGTMAPYALEVLAAGLRANLSGIDIAIIDFRLERRAAALAKIRAFRPGLIGITGITIDFPEMVRLLRELKAEYGDRVLTVVGGHHASMVPQDFHLPECDVIVRGPGIAALTALASAPCREAFNNINNIEFRHDQHGFIRTAVQPQHEEILHWPIPAYDLTQQYKNQYRCFGRRYSVVTTSLGCPFRCAFCACWKAFDEKFASRPANAVVDDIRAAPHQYIFFGDDLSFGNIKQAKEIADLIRRSGLRKKYVAYCRADLIVKHPEIIEMWRDIGLEGITIGMESFRQDDLGALNKKTTIATNHQANDLLLALGVHNHAHLMVKPAFSKQDFEELATYSLRIGTTHPAYPVLTPLPGTDLAEQVADRFVTRQHQYFDLAHPVTDIKAEDIDAFYTHLKNLYFNNYSYVRWLKSLMRKAANLLARKPLYSRTETNCPELISIPYMRMWIRRLMRKRKSYTKALLK